MARTPDCRVLEEPGAFGDGVASKDGRSSTIGEAPRSRQRRRHFSAVVEQFIVAVAKDDMEVWRTIASMCASISDHGE